MRKWLAGAALLVLFVGLGGCSGIPELSPRVPESATAEPVAGREHPEAIAALSPVPFDAPAGAQSPWGPSQQAPELGPLPVAEGSPDLTISALPNGGWEVNSAQWAVSGLGQTEFDGPTGGVTWLDGGRVLFRWYRKSSARFLIADVSTGRLLSLPGYEEMDSASPDGRYLILRRNSNTLATVLVDTRSVAEIWNLPTGYAGTRWLNGHLFAFYHDQNSYVGDAVRRIAWRLPESASSVVALGDQVCYSFAEQSNRYRTGVNCLDTLSGSQTGLLHPGEIPDAPYPTTLSADPSGRWLVAGYRRQATKGAWLDLTGVAYATKPLPPMVWADTLLFFDSKEQRLRHLALPYVALVEARWSPDGAHLGLRLSPERKDPYAALVNGHLWTLEVATGKMRRLAAVSPESPAGLLFSLKEGSLLINRSTVHPPQLALLSPGKGPVAWQPDRKALALTPPGPPWWNGPPPPLVSVISENQLLLYAESGESYTWVLPGSIDTVMAHATPDSAYRWIAVQKVNQGKSGRLILITR